MDRLSLVRALASLKTDKQRENDGVYTPPEVGIEYRRKSAIVSFNLPVSELDRNAADTLDAFFQDVDESRGVISEIEALTVELQNKHTVNLQTIDQNVARQLRSEIQTLSGRCNEKASLAKERLDTMNKKTETLKKDPVMLQANTAIVRIQDNQYRYLFSKLMQVMEIYRKLQMTNEASYKDHTVRQIKIMCKNSENTEIDDDTAKQLAQQVLDNNLNSYIFQQSKEVLATIIETRNDIFRIEHSMRELNRIFNDMAILVNEQGELLDVVLNNVQSSSRYVETALSELQRAKKLQKKVNKKLICIVLIVAITLLLFTLIIIASTIKV